MSNLDDVAPIQLFVPHFRIDEVLSEIRECLERGWTGMGFKTVEIENAWKSYTGLEHAHFLNSATAALHVAVQLYKDKLGWQDGDEIISTPLTFVSTNHAILYSRMKVVMADIDEHLCLSPEDIERKITPKTRAIIFVGLGGNTGRLAEVAELCRQRGLILILDAAHMSGTKLNGKDPGDLADVTCYSFQAVKNMPTCDSGMISFRDGELDRLARQFSWLGISKDTYARAQKGTYSWLYDVDNIGYKYNGNAVVAGMALVALKYLDQDNAYRRQISAWYDQAFAGHNVVGRIPVAKGCVPSRHLYQVRLGNRDDVLTGLQAAKIFPGVHYRDNSEYKLYRDQVGQCPEAAKASAEILSLPIHMSLKEADVQRVAQAVIELAR